MKKKVDVFCAGAFVINGAPFAGKCLNIILDIEDIRTCLLNKAFVWELTKEGKRIPLNFTNYRIDNGGVVDNNVITSVDARMKNTNMIRKVVDPETSKVIKETKVVVEKVEKDKPKVMTDKKKEVVIEKKKEEVKEDIKIEAVVEQMSTKETQTTEEPETTTNNTEQAEVNLDKLKEKYDKGNGKHKK